MYASAFFFMLYTQCKVLILITCIINEEGFRFSSSVFPNTYVMTPLRCVSIACTFNEDGIRESFAIGIFIWDLGLA